MHGRIFQQPLFRLFLASTPVLACIDDLHRPASLLVPPADMACGAPSPTCSLGRRKPAALLHAALPPAVSEPSRSSAAAAAATAIRRDSSVPRCRVGVKGGSGVEAGIRAAADAWAPPFRLRFSLPPALAPLLLRTSSLLLLLRRLRRPATRHSHMSRTASPGSANSMCWRLSCGPSTRQPLMLPAMIRNPYARQASPCVHTASASVLPVMLGGARLTAAKCSCNACSCALLRVVGSSSGGSGSRMHERRWGRVKSLYMTSCAHVSVWASRNPVAGGVGGGAPEFANLWFCVLLTSDCR